MEQSDVPGGPNTNTVDASAGDYLTQVFAVAAAEAQKLRHDPIELLTRAVQPVLWLMLFGEVMARVRGVAPGGIAHPRGRRPARLDAGECRIGVWVDLR